MADPAPRGVPFARALFDRTQAFSRTVGLVTHDELALLGGKRVAIAGMGGVGGLHLVTCARLGVGRFHVADFDAFELHNMNRQAGAFMSTLDQLKTEVMARTARDINPELDLKVWNEGVGATNVDAFLEGVDVYLDGLDFFAFAARRLVFERCWDKGIPIVTAGPIAMGAALLVFSRGGMSPMAYFDWQDGDDDEALGMKFLVGLTPALPHLKQIVDRSALSFAEHRGPSTPMGCALCAGVAGTEVMKLLLGRGHVPLAPRSVHFDAFTNRLHNRVIWMGNRNPLQRLKIAAGLRQLRAARAKT